MMDLVDRLLSYVYTRRLWGPRCGEYEPGCYCCRAWRLHDWAFHEAYHPDDGDAVGTGRAATLRRFAPPVVLTDRELREEEEVAEYEVRCGMPKGDPSSADRLLRVREVLRRREKERLQG